MQPQESSTATDSEKKQKLRSLITYITRAQSFSMASGGKVDHEETKHTEMQFDEAGNLVSEIKYQSNGMPEEKSTYAFNDNNELISETTYHAVEDFEERREIVRDEKGQVLRELKHYPDGSCDTTELTLNEKGDVCEITVTDDEGTLETRQELNYDTKGNMIKQVKLDADGNEEEIFMFEYNDDGKIVRRQTINKLEETETTENLEYDKEGREILAEAFDAQGQLIYRTQLEYNAQGKPTLNRTEYPLDRADNRVVKYEYDEQGNCKTETVEGVGETVLRVSQYAYNSDNKIVSEDTITTDQAMGMRVPHSLRYEYTYF